jgi:hypothetical protein
MTTISRTTVAPSIPGYLLTRSYWIACGLWGNRLQQPLACLSFEFRRVASSLADGSSMIALPCCHEDCTCCWWHHKRLEQKYDRIHSRYADAQVCTGSSSGAGLLLQDRRQPALSPPAVGWPSTREADTQHPALRHMRPAGADEVCPLPWLLSCTM